MTGAQHDNFLAEPTGWTALTPDEKREAVRQAVQVDGLTYEQAYIVLKATSREAIAGVVERAKRSGNPIISSSGLKYGGDTRSKGGKTYGKKVQANDARTKKVKHAGLHRYVALPFPAAPVDPAPASADVWTALPGSSPVAIEDHREGGCRFPVGAESPFAFCNNPIKTGSMYCPAHTSLCHRALPAAAKRKETA